MSEIKPCPERNWTCFHCGETFTTPGSARDHFGFDPSCDPACRIKLGAERGLVMALRKAEADCEEMRRLLHDEASEAYRLYASQATRHREQIMAAEESGYEKGLTDGRAEADRASDVCASVQKERDDLREKHDHLEHIIDRDRYIVAHGLQAIKKVLSGYDWLSEGRGSYEFDDERYQKEFGDALDAIRGSLKTLECLAFDKAHCTTDPNKVHAARHGALAFLARYEGGRKS